MTAGWPGSAPVVRDLSFAVRPGEIVGVTGPVACGKSTLGKILIGEVPYDGSIRVCGRELRELSARERSGLISYMGHDGPQQALPGHSAPAPGAVRSAEMETKKCPRCGADLPAAASFCPAWPFASE